MLTARVACPCPWRGYAIQYPSSAFRHAWRRSLHCYLPDDNLVCQDHAGPCLAAGVPHKRALDPVALPGRGIELGRALGVPPGEGFGIAGKVGGQRFGIVGFNEPDTGSLNVHVTWASLMRINRHWSVSPEAELAGSARVARLGPGARSCESEHGGRLFHRPPATRSTAPVTYEASGPSSHAMAGATRRADRTAQRYVPGDAVRAAASPAAAWMPVPSCPEQRR